MAQDKKRALLLIDPQNDFCDSKNGALGVPGAEEDCKGMEGLLQEGDFKFNDVFITLDTHYPIDISHPHFWHDGSGNEPNPLTIITSEDVEENWFPKNPEHAPWAKVYIEKLEEDGKYNHLIWPTHCIHGSWGYRIQDDVMQGLQEWSIKNDKNFHVIEKGKSPFTEHFGAFQAQVEITGYPETFFNEELFKILNTYDEVHIAGEAETHCVGSTLDQLRDRKEIVKKLNIHYNMMSPVPGFEGSVDHIIQDLKDNGSQILGDA